MKVRNYDHMIYSKNQKLDEYIYSFYLYHSLNFIDLFILYQQILANLFYEILFDFYFNNDYYNF